ncbi:oxidoreductase, short chain dehydrogenase/reductase family protein [Trichomonas vaginalis G3]|uniref:Oxidoreductase, short chain dehydrogenase/reductase family protein n=1 Tax=Trichomonas vaginalis (strain ATCC PRA-98 / G3) TaxID=412133 RepID=A2FTC7_TRIV3|nr:oxidation-reduction process [Trichomonas vaginalis G3]EAX91847.1 oxidoreductase, short chain dehydrogenase/reductase family protein [Trichomonas vaginalis G3]KAI5512609.1 oxidation-reduction process [Trichomonas vaginalis G3]|eukprot:XP_001304777.1 oxidoreductase, short chain dehydrogenase/reductase family protein [Trichomonas vaginalis G3]
MQSKIIVITCSSDGIGRYTAKILAKQEHTIIMHGRNPEKTKEAYEEVKKESGNEKVDYFLADFLDFKSIKEFADKIKEKYDHIDVLINNAGAQFGTERQLTKEGYEKTMMINTYAPFLLTTLLLDSLKKSKSGRVVTTTSASHNLGGEPDLKDLEMNKNYSVTRSYGLSKLYVIWIMRHFIKEVERQGIKNVTFNLVHPGSTTTNLGRESTKGFGMKFLYTVFKPFNNTMAEAADPEIFAATSPTLEGISGKYFGPKGEDKIYEKTYTEEREQKLWDYCMNITAPYRN